MGVGIDLTEIPRIRSLHDRHGECFLRRIYTSAEEAYCLSMKNPYPSLAARFAAKEAVSKAFGTGIGAEIGFTDIEVCRGERGEPLVSLHGNGLQLMKTVGASTVLLSLSHTKETATAIALLIES